MVTELFGSSGQQVSDPVLDRLRLATLGTYDIAGELGRGGMAIVYVARDLKLARTVAIKVMDPRLALAQGMADRFLQEARIAASLQHPNIIVVHDIQHSGELIFFVMGLVEGGSLDELCRHGEPLPIEQARWILLQASRALAFAHSERITHRDVKPANILVNLKGDIILTDFGIAKAVGGDSMTKSGTQIGTPTYMSPEQFGNVAAGPASDQYALGVTAYHLLTGETPFTGDLYQLVAAHISAQAVPIRDVRPDCPAFLANAVMRMLEKKPADRWPSLDDLIGVFGANMAVDGGLARKQLAMSARTLHHQRATSVAALTARAPLSPTPTNAASTSRTAAPPPESLVVSISPPGATIFVRGTLQLKASVVLESGEPLRNAMTLWSSSDPAVVTVADDGTLEGVATGITMVRATVHGAWEEAMIRVEPAPIARVTVATPQITIKIGELVRPQVTAVDVNGVARDDVTFAWTSRTPGVAQLDAPGCIRAMTPGDAVIEVSVGNMRRLIEITVVRRPVSSVRIHKAERRMELGDARALQVDVIDDQGHPTSPGAVQWTSSDPSSIYVDSAGTALAIGPGVSRITASVDDASDVIELESVESPIGSIEVAVESAQVEIGDRIAVELRVRDITGAARSSAGVRCWSSDPAIARIDITTMEVWGIAAGRVQIHAACDDAPNGTCESSATLDVTPVAIERVHVVPSTLEVELGAVTTFVVHYSDALGRAVADVNATIESAVPSVAAVEPFGTVRGMAAGATEVRVAVRNADGRTVEARIPVRVRKAGLARFAIHVPRPIMEAGSTVTLSLSAWDTTGAEISDITAVWRSSDSATAEVSASGQVHALRAGNVVISAELGRLREQVAIGIYSVPLATLIIENPATDLIVGTATRLSAAATDINGQRAHPSVQFTVDPPDAARIRGDELTPLGAGAFTVRAVLTESTVSSPGPTGVREATASFSAVPGAAQSIREGSRDAHGGASVSRRTVVAVAGGVGALVLAIVVWQLGTSESAAPPVNANATNNTASAPVAIPPAIPVLTLGARSLVVTLGDSATVSARIDSAGVPMTGAENRVQWQSLDNAKVIASPAGVLRGRSVGVARVVATRGALSDTVIVNVAPRERQLASLRLSGRDTVLPVGSSQQLSVDFLDEQRLVMTRDLPRATWSSSDGAAVRVSASGVITVLAEKGATITVSAGNLSTRMQIRGRRAVAAAPVARSAQDEFESTIQAFERAPSDRALARVTRSRLDSLESLLVPGEQARAVMYMGRTSDALGERDEACRSFSRALSMRGVQGLSAQIEDARRKSGCVAAESPKPEPVVVPAKKQSELKAELDSAVVRYTRAFESRDAARVRAAFPSIPKAKLDGYANMFREARELSVELGSIAAAGGQLPETVGATVDVTVPVLVTFRPRSGAPTESRTEWKMRLQRTANGWMLIALE